MVFKKNLVFLVIGFTVLLIILVAFCFTGFFNPLVDVSPSTTISPTASATNSPTPDPTISPLDYDVEAQRLFNQALTIMEQLRNVSIPQVNLRVVTKDWAIQTWGVSSAQGDQKNIQIQENIYKALLFISQNDSLYQATVDWAGYFMAVTQAGTIYIVKENFNITNTLDAAATMAHELTHVMPITYNIPQYYYSYDASKARSALTEGDACFTANFVKNLILTGNTPNPEPDSVPQNKLLTNNPNDESLFASIPDSVYDLDYFPYKFGEKFVQALYERGGWEMINQAYKNPPNSTEQILHPEKYYAAELPDTISDTKPSGGNWTKKWGAQYGEFFIQNMLSTNLTEYEVEKSSSGWGGDRLTYYESQDNNYLITWNIKWDTFTDSAEFLVGFTNYMKNAGAQEIQSNQWQSTLINQKIVWDQKANSTLIIASTDLAALQLFK